MKINSLTCRKFTESKNNKKKKKQMHECVRVTMYGSMLQWL